MGNCKYCGQSAGFLRSQHKECADRHESAARSIKALCVDAALHGAGLDGLPGRIREVAATGRIDVAGDRMTETLSNGWCDAVEASMEDHALSSDEKRGLNRYRTRFNLHENRLDSDGHFELFRMMALLNSLVDQAVVPRFDRRSARAQFGRLPFNLMKSEELIWVFRDVGYIQQVTRREFRGGSMGMSFRVTKGVYVRPGAFRGRSVASKSMEHTDSGMLGITTKHIYFTGRRREELPGPFTMGAADAWFSVNIIDALLDMDRIALPKSDALTLDDIVDEDPGDDDDDDAGPFIAGAGASLYTARATPEAFTMGAADAWFSVNIIDALLDMDRIALPKSDAPTLDDIVDEDACGDDADPNDDDAGPSSSLPARARRSSQPMTQARR